MRVQIKCQGDGVTKQSMKDECNINKIMERYTKTGRLPEMIKKDPKYGDFAKLTDYQSALNILSHAQQTFDLLSLEVRKFFDYDPGKMLEFVDDPRNGAKLVELGLAIPRKKVDENTVEQPKGEAEGEQNNGSK